MNIESEKVTTVKIATADMVILLVEKLDSLEQAAKLNSGTLIKHAMEILIDGVFYAEEKNVHNFTGNYDIAYTISKEISK